MASIFTFDPDPPRVASPWLRSTSSGHHGNRALEAPLQDLSLSSSDVDDPLQPGTNTGSPRLTRLQAEPQEGPIEYKLHLLLRPRRKFRSTSTGSHISGSRHARLADGQPSRNMSESVVQSRPSSGTTTPPPSSTQQTRQHRLEQLTTQLLWRLQQSSPYHTSSATNIILPSLPEALPELEAPRVPAKLLHGLEESQGALYEIGVADDGSLVGLAEDEMHESLNNLRAMAGCLGCSVEVLRSETVGNCEWLEDVPFSSKDQKACRTGQLVVCEALVKPLLWSKSPPSPGGDVAPEQTLTDHFIKRGDSTTSSTEQLRITLTGPTMSGKSSLLGTLTTSTLDNGRGKSRLSMLRHRHEINSGITSSVTQELLGYQDASDGAVDVVNYATGNVASWIDIHVAASGSRLVLISDSAGHPRYRRTTVRGIVGWAPHWTLLCVPADDAEHAAGELGGTGASQASRGPAASDMNLSQAQLDLCLKLRLPLVVVMTKLDLASRSALKSSLTKVLNILKAAGRRPAILANPSGEVAEEYLQCIEASVIEGAYNIALPLLNDPTASVPIVLSSAVQGTGVANLHALLHELPIPIPRSTSAINADFVFYIEDIYTKPAETEGVVVSGRIRSGIISVEDTGALGPFTYHDFGDSEDSTLPTSRSFPGALREAHTGPRHFQLPNQEWRRFRITSIRNLRLPVHSLLADQIGTIAIVPDDTKDKARSAAAFARIRKGMVLTAVQPQAVRSFIAEFRREDLESLAVGNHVVVYIASVRASARVVSAQAPHSSEASHMDLHEQSTDHTGMVLEDFTVGTRKSDANGQDERVAGMVTAANLLVTFSFDASREFIILGDRVLVMPGGGPSLYGGQERGQKGIAGLEGFVGTITEVMG